MFSIYEIVNKDLKDINDTKVSFSLKTLLEYEDRRSNLSPLRWKIVSVIIELNSI